jgi:fatty-acid desaturase
MPGSTVLLAGQRPERPVEVTAPPKISTWPSDVRGGLVFAWLLLIHVTAAVGLVLYPVPGWRLLLACMALTFAGGVGVTVCYHRALAHRSLTLHPAIRSVLIFLAMMSDTPPPRAWVPYHRFHHATADTPADLSSPVWHGLWFAHVAQYWQAGGTIPLKYSEDLKRLPLRIWDYLLVPIFFAAFFGGALFGARGFFWLGAIRLVFAFHGQSLVNSVCHTQPGIRRGEDSSRNVWWVAVAQLCLGESWHRNHHASPSSARFGRGWRQPDLGYFFLVAFEKLGLASDVRRIGRGRATGAHATGAPAQAQVAQPTSSSRWQSG